MMELIRSWLIGVTCAAMVVALAESLTPEGTVKRIGKLAGGLVLILAVIRPLASLNYEAMSSALTGYQMDIDGYSNTLELENQRLLEIIISEQTGAYIQDKAAELGLTVCAEVSCGQGEDGTLYPVSVTVSGDLTEEDVARLSRVIEAELAIPADCQEFERTDAE